VPHDALNIDEDDRDTRQRIDSAVRYRYT